MTPKRTRRLRARAAAIHQNEDYEDYGPEPNMKLSHAFLVVLMLHVVAVGGLYAFNSMKAGRQTSVSKVASPPPATPKGSEDSPGEGGGSPSGKPSGGGTPAPVAKVGGEGGERVNQSTSVTQSGAKEVSGGAKGWISGLKKAMNKGGAPASTVVATAGAVAQEAPVPPASTTATTAAGAGGAKTYVVKAGDTVTRIAAELGVAIPDFEKANGLKADSVLQVGQVLTVPAAKSATVPVVAAAQDQGNLSVPPVAAPVAGSASVGGPAPVAAADQSGLAEYTVVKGDNPYKLAKKFRVTPDELMKANGITDPKKIQIGQKLRVPQPTQKPKGK
jgi:LysM repeat protein